MFIMCDSDRKPIDKRMASDDRDQMISIAKLYSRNTEHYPAKVIIVINEANEEIIAFVYDDTVFLPVDN